MFFASGAFLRRLIGELDTPIMSKFSHTGSVRVYTHNAAIRRVRSTLPKPVTPSKDVRFGDLNDVPLKFGKQTPQN